MWPADGVDGDELIRIHESAHLAIAAALGFRPTGVTVKPGRVLDGCSTHALGGLPAGVMEGALQALNNGLPFIAWPGPMRSRVEALVVIKMAGQVAELTLGERVPATARLPATVAEQAEQQAAELPDPPAALVERYAKLVDDQDAAESDADAVATLASAAFGEDLPSMHGWLSFLEGQTRMLVLGEATKIRRLAQMLAIRHTLSGEAVAAVLAR